MRHERFIAATKAVDGVLSHYSAATLWRLVHYEPDSPVHVTIPHTARRAVAGVFVHRTRNAPEVIRLDAIPVTTPARALIDLSSTQSVKPLRRAVREGFALRRVELHELRGRTKQLDAALAQGYVPTESELEDATHDLILSHFEPPPPGSPRRSRPARHLGSGDLPTRADRQTTPERGCASRLTWTG